MKKMIRLDKYNNIKEDTEGIYTLESIESDNEYRNSEESSDYISSENELSDQEIEENYQGFKKLKALEDKYKPQDDTYGGNEGYNGEEGQQSPEGEENQEDFSNF